MTIEICKDCSGTGVTKHTTGYHNSDWEERVCTNCKGSGRVKVRVFSYEVPFGVDANTINIYETNILNHIRELEKVTRTSYESKN